MRRVLAAVVVLVIGFAVIATAEEKRAFEIADYYRTAFVGAPEVSPD